jgi:hypothetical protein
MPNRNSTGPAPAGSVVRGSGKDGPQRIRVNGQWWTPKAEQAFLDFLATSCNVSWSAAQTGFSAVTVYNRRRADPAFAAKWQAALEQGYARLEMELVGTATDFLGQLRLDPELSLKAMSVKEAISLLGMHRAVVKNGEARRPGWQARPRSLEEMRASILTKLEAIEAARIASQDGGGDAA